MAEVLLIISAAITAVSLIICAVDFVLKTNALFSTGVWLAISAWAFGVAAGISHVTAIWR